MRKGPLLGAVVALLLSACSGGSGDVTAVQTPLTATASPTPAASASPSASASASIAELPESVLVTIPGLTYVEPPNGSDAALRTLGQSAQHPEALEGAIIRGLQGEADGTLYGFAYVLRFASSVGQGISDSAQHDMLKEFAQGDGERSTVAGQPVWQAEKSRATNVAVVLYADGNDLIVLAAGSLDNARELASYWIKGAS